MGETVRFGNFKVNAGPETVNCSGSVAVAFNYHFRCLNPSTAIGCLHLLEKARFERMCGRFTVTADGETVRREFGLPAVPFDYRPRYNVAPMQDVLTVAAGPAAARAGWMRWGLVPSWADDPAIGSRMINARAETLERKPAYREAFERRRCLIVADGFYEWRRVGSTKIPMRIRLKTGRLFAFAGLWDRWSKEGRPLVTCTILTTTPSPSIAAIHDRMPVILSRENARRWIDSAEDCRLLSEMLLPFPDDQLEMYAVSTLVNHVDNDSPECSAPAHAAPVTEQTSLF